MVIMFNCFCTNSQTLLARQSAALRTDPVLSNDGRLLSFINSFGGDTSMAAKALVDKYIRQGVFGNNNYVEFELDPVKSETETTQKRRTLYCIPEFDVNLYETDLANWMAFHPAVITSSNTTSNKTTPKKQGP